MGFEENMVFVPADFSAIKDKNFKMPLMLYLADKSIYMEDEGVRIYPDKVNCSEIARETTLKDRRTVKKALDYMLETDKVIARSHEVIYFDNNNQDFIVGLPHKTLRKMYADFSDYTCKIFLYLYRQYRYWTIVRHSDFDFTLSQLCESIGLSPQTKNREMAKYSLEQLVAERMLEYDAVKKGNVCYRRVIDMTV